MPNTLKLLVPDLGDFSDVDIIEVLVKTGDQIDVEESVITLETDKASMDVPATHAGKVISVQVAVGDKVSAGDLVLTLEAADEPEDGFEATMVISPAKQRALAAAALEAPGAAPRPAPATANSTELVVIGAGVGGYTAAFRAADLGLEVTLVERWPVLGGVCLNVGCIPSKALLHVAKFIDEAEAMADQGIQFGKPRINAIALRAWKNKVVDRLTGGLTQLAKQRKVNVVHATAKFESAKRLVLDNGETIDFRQCIIAAGSESIRLPGIPEDPRIMDSTAALELDPLPKRMLVVGGGIIGLEMACVYSALGTSVSVIEMTDALMPGTDPDLVIPFQKIIDKRDEKILLETKATRMTTTLQGAEVR